MRASRTVVACDTSIPHPRRSCGMQRVPKIITLLDNPPSGVQGFTRGMAPFHPAVPAPVLHAVAGTECSRSAADSAIRAARNDAENTIPACERRSLSPRAAPICSPHSPRRIVANRAGLRSPNPPISSSNERIISRGARRSHARSRDRRNSTRD